MLVELLGFTGMVLVVAGWAVALRGPPPPIRLSALYSAGSLLLTIYATVLGDPVFTALNAAALAFAALNIWRALRRRGGALGQAAAT